MTRILLAAAGLVLGSLTITATPASAQAAARHYDCSKAGNATKAACKGATPAKPSPASAPKPAAAPAKPRNYDCAKPGNASKAACKTAPAAAKPRNYDCTKPGNANKAVCKGAAPAPRPAPAPAAHPAAAAKPAPAGEATNPRGPNGATAQCKDGSYSHSAHRSGTCAGHKGVATWY